MSDGELAMRLHTTVLRVSDLHAACEYYQNVFGLECVFYDRVLKFSELASKNGDGQRLTLHEPDEPFERSSKMGVLPVWMSGNLDQDRKVLEGRGAILSPIENHPGYRIFWLTDPDGNEVPVMTFTV